MAGTSAHKAVCGISALTSTLHHHAHVLSNVIDRKQQAASRVETSTTMDEGLDGDDLHDAPDISSMLERMTAVDHHGSASSFISQGVIQTALDAFHSSAMKKRDTNRIHELLKSLPTPESSSLSSSSSSSTTAIVPFIETRLHRLYVHESGNFACLDLQPAIELIQRGEWKAEDREVLCHDWKDYATEFGVSLQEHGVHTARMTIEPEDVAVWPLELIQLAIGMEDDIKERFGYYYHWIVHQLPRLIQAHRLDVIQWICNDLGIHIWERDQLPHLLTRMTDITVPMEDRKSRTVWNRAMKDFLSLTEYRHPLAPLLDHVDSILKIALYRKNTHAIQWYFGRFLQGNPHEIQSLPKKLLEEFKKWAHENNRWIFHQLTLSRVVPIIQAEESKYYSYTIKEYDDMGDAHAQTLNVKRLLDRCNDAKQVPLSEDEWKSLERAIHRLVLASIEGTGHITMEPNDLTKLPLRLTSILFEVPHGSNEGMYEDLVHYALPKLIEAHQDEKLHYLLVTHRTGWHDGHRKHWLYQLAEMKGINSSNWDVWIETLRLIHDDAKIQRARISRPTLFDPYEFLRRALHAQNTAAINWYYTQYMLDKTIGTTLETKTTVSEQVAHVQQMPSSLYKEVVNYAYNHHGRGRGSHEPDWAMLYCLNKGVSTTNNGLWTLLTAAVEHSDDETIQECFEDHLLGKLSRMEFGKVCKKELLDALLKWATSNEQHAILHFLTPCPFLSRLRISRL